MPSLNFSLLSSAFFFFLDELKEPSTGKEKEKKKGAKIQVSGVEKGKIQRYRHTSASSHSTEDSPYFCKGHASVLASNPSCSENILTPKGLFAILNYPISIANHNIINSRINNSIIQVTQ